MYGIIIPELCQLAFCKQITKKCSAFAKGPMKTN